MYKSGRVRHFFAILVVLISFAWMIIPMLLLQGDYCFTIHDGMDSYAGMVQFIHDNHLYFHLNQKLPFMNGIEGKYTFLGYTLYDFYNCVFGYVTGQILTRITGVILGFFTFKHLIEHLYPERSDEFRDGILLVAALYILTPVSPLRMIGFASLPLVVDTYVYMLEDSKTSKLCMLGLLFPILSVFDALFIFVLGFWLLFAITDLIRERKANKNLFITFFLMVISTIMVNINFFRVALIADETSRGIYVDGFGKFDFSWDLFWDYLLNGQYHATAYPKWILIPAGIVLSIYVFFSIPKESLDDKERLSVWMIITGWIIPIMGTLIMTCQESGLKLGFILVDGFQWGRLIALSRFTWPLMIIGFFYLLYKKAIIRKALFMIVYLQILYVVTVRSSYNDTFFSVINQANAYVNGNKPLISYNEFASEDLFDEIKEDIDYNWEGVVAYGYHPSVLWLNNFNTIDGYFTVHSMDWQNEFREIIEPALDRSDYYRNYYDTWGGRMYIYGPLSYEPTKNKMQDPTYIYINVDAYKKYGGKYVLSRAQLLNADEQGLRFVKDYDMDNSLYHIYLYTVEGES